MKKIIVYGAGEFGTLIANVISYIEKYTIGAYGDDNPIKSGTFIDGLPVYGQEDLLNFAIKNNINIAISAIGNNKVRGEMGTAIHTHSTIGNNVFLGGDALIGHHNTIGNHVLVGGNVSFGGAVLVEDYVSIGVGASIKPGVRLGKGCTVGVGAAVVKDVAPGTTVVGVPAKPI
jgi:acetyltransferase-like isoleucine patch superfamily enzyme